MNILPQISKDLPKEVKEGFDTDMMAIMEFIIQKETENHWLLGEGCGVCIQTKKFITDRFHVRSVDRAIQKGE